MSTNNSAGHNKTSCFGGFKLKHCLLLSGMAWASTAAFPVLAQSQQPLPTHQPAFSKPKPHVAAPTPTGSVRGATDKIDNKPAPNEAVAGDALLGEWKFKLLNAPSDQVGSLIINKGTHESIGATIEGVLRLNAAETCNFSGFIFDSVMGLYPAGSRIQQIPIGGYLQGKILCPDGNNGALDAFIVDKDKAISKSSGRIVWMKQRSSDDKGDFFYLYR